MSAFEEVAFSELQRWAVGQGWILMDKTNGKDIYLYLTPGGDLVRVETRDDRVLHVTKEGAK